MAQIANHALSTFKVKSLKHLAFLTGCVASSTKAELQQRVLRRLTNITVRSKPIRIVSVDMGIRNLAYCVLDTSTSTKKGNSISSDLHVVAWQKLDLLEQLKHGGNGVEDMAAEQALKTFSPESVSKLAYTTTSTLLSYKPDVILIEEQRFRSSGGSAIQEWTVRVNMLESMLWACVETLRFTSPSTTFPKIYSVSPAKVAKFWMAGHQMSLSPDFQMIREGASMPGEPSGRVKITKKDKIAVLQSWLQGKDDNSMVLSFAEGPSQTAARFRSSTSKEKLIKSHGKLDDLTDCVLQGAAWWKWEYNSSKIASMLAIKDSS